MKTRFVNYLHFSRNERLGTFALLFFFITAFSIPSILELLRPPSNTDFSEFEAAIQAYRASAGAEESTTSQNFDFDPNLATADDFKKLGLSEKVAKNICRFREKGGSFRKPEDFQKIWELPAADYARLLPYIHISMGNKSERKYASNPDPEYFPFDPNTATEQDFAKLGLPTHTIKGILNYRSKGGVFRKKEDFAKIYSLSQVDYERLEPYIIISKPTAYQNDLRPGMYAGGGYYPAKTSGSIDINRSDVEAWATLPMIGQGRAKQIVNYRQRLGGFRSIEQVAEVFNFPDSVYQRIKPQLSIANTELHKINLNTISPEELRKHPYLSWKQADLIIAYRSQHGPFAKVDDVLKIKAFTDKVWWEKVSPYFAVE
jgi:DNA uptake protein ComE-like DNA-binding protein